MTCNNTTSSSGVIWAMLALSLQPRSSTVRSIASLVSGGRYGGHAMKRTSTDGMLTIRGEKKTERDEGQGQELACRAQLRPCSLAARLLALS